MWYEAYDISFVKLKKLSLQSHSTETFALRVVESTKNNASGIDSSSSDIYTSIYKALQNFISFFVSRIVSHINLGLVQELCVIGNF